MTGQSETKARQWPDNIVGGDLMVGQAFNYSGFYLAPADHGIPTCGAVQEKGGRTSVEVFNYPGQTESIAKQLAHRWNCHDHLVAALKALDRARVTDSTEDWARAAVLSDAALAKAGA